MTDLPKDLKYTKNHEWLRMTSDNEGIIGITDYAQRSLGDVTYVELPQIGLHYNKDQPFSIIESVKAASDIYMPVDGQIIAVNNSLDNNPGWVNSAPYSDGWIIKIKIASPNQFSELLSSQDYQDIIGPR